MSRSTTPERPLRERNRERNRADVAAIAVELFTSRGFDEVTIDDIASAAGISRRTFFRYFESKEDAVLPYEHERLEQFRELLAARPSDEPVMATVRRAAVAIVTDRTMLGRRDIGSWLRLIRDTPSVHARSLELRSRWEDEVRQVIAEHLGVDPATSLEANVLAGAAIAATRAPVDVWVADGCTSDLTTLVERSFDLLLHGLADSDRV